MLLNHQPHTTPAYPSNVSQLTPLPVTGKRYRRSESDGDSSSDSQQSYKNSQLFYAARLKGITQKERIEKIKETLEQGANINAQDLNYRDNTPLHIAVQDNEPQVAKFLLDQGADASIKNKEGNRAIDLLSNKKRKSNAGGSSTSSWDSELIAHLEAVAAVHKPLAIAGPSGLSAGGSSGTSKPLEYAAGGLKHSLHGNIYQLQLLTLFMKRALDNHYDFLLATEMNAAEKFDDVVFRYTEQGETHYRFLQAKHRQEESQRLTLRDLMNQSEGDFSLSKYFASYLKIKGKSEFQGHQVFILCTNIDLAVEELTEEGTLTVEEIKDKDDFITIKDSTKTPHRYRLTVDKHSNFYRQLQVNPELHQLATILIERLEKNKRLDFTADVFKRYHLGLVKEKIIDIDNKKIHDDFILGDKLSASAQKFRDIFIQTALKNKIYQNNPNKLWDTFKDKKLSVSRNFGSGEETPQFPTNSVIDASEIDTFFKQFTFAVNQPNEVQLRTVLAREIGTQFNLLDSELVADHIQRQMLDWFKERGGKFLSTREGTSYFNDALTRINTLLSTGSSIEQAAKLGSYGIHFNQPAITTLQPAIKNIRALHLITAETRLEALKVYQLLQTLPEYQQQDSVLFTELSTLSLREPCQRLFKAFEAANSHLLLVIECSRETVNGDITEIVGQLALILERHPQKKLIIIAPEAHPLAASFKEHNHLSYHSVVEAPTFNELAAKTQQTLLDKEVLFQGHRVTLRQLLPTNFPRDTLPLMALIESNEETPLPIGPALPAAPSEAKGYYLKRRMTPTFIKYSIIRAQQAGTFPDWVVFNEESFEVMCQNHPGKAVHWLQHRHDNDKTLLLWQQSQGDMIALQPYLEDSPHAIATAQKALAPADFSTFSQLESHQVVLLSAPAGMGKSTFLTHTAQQLKRQQPDHWVIRVDLNQQTEALQRLLPASAEVTPEWVVEAAQLQTPFEQQLLRQALQAPRSAKVRLLLDGFDEICPTHQTSALKLLKGLRERYRAQIWVTTRPHWEGVLAQHCQTLPFSLSPPSHSQQLQFLTDYCRAQQPLDSKQVTAVEKQAEVLLNHLVSSDISTENLLHLQMLAELFSDKFKANQFFTETELKQFNRLELYEQFVETKYKIFRHKGSEAGAQIDKVTKSSIDVENNHQRLAVTLLFPEQQQRLLKALSLNEIKLLSPEALARYGMVTGVKNAPQFIHRTYAEYFVAELLWERAIKNPQGSPAGADFLLCDVLPQEAQQGVNAFLDCWLARDSQALDPSRYTLYGSRLQELEAGARPLYQSRMVEKLPVAQPVPETAFLQAAHNGHGQMIDFLCHSLNAAQQTETLRKLLTCWDDSLNNLLHLAIEPGHVETVTTLLHWMEAVHIPSLDAILIHENQQQQTPVHLAVEENQAEITKKLLQWSSKKLSAEKFQDLLFHKNGERQTLLRVAILEGHAEITTDLLAWYDQAEIGVERVIQECFLKRNKYGQTLYQLVREHPSVEIFKIPLQWVMKKLEAQQVQKNPDNPPYQYSDEGKSGLATQLAHQDIQDQRLIQTFFDSFLMEGNKRLLCSIWESKHYSHTQLFRAILENDRAVIDQFQGEALKTILSEPEPLFKLNALHLAAWQGSAEVLSQLLHAIQPYSDLSQGQQWLRQQDWLGQTPLHLAILYNQEKITQQLLDVGGSLGILPDLLLTRDWYGSTPLALSIVQDKASFVRQIVNAARQFMSPEQQEQLLLTPASESSRLLHLVVDRDPSLLSSLLQLAENLPPRTVKALLLTPNANGRALLSHLLAKHYYVEAPVVDQILQLSSQALPLSEQQVMLQSVVESPSVAQRADLDFVQRLQQRLTQVISEHTALCSVSLAGLRTLLQQTHWLRLSDCAAGSSRTRRAASECTETRTERALAYQPLEDRASYLPEQIQAAHQNSQFALMVAWRKNPQQGVEALMDYQRAVGAILSEGEANHSPREKEILETYYRQAQQFCTQFPKEALFNPITTPLADLPLSGAPQSWLFENGRCSLLLLRAGKRYALYSPDFNYQHLLYASPEVTKKQITSWVNAFFQWRTGKAGYTVWTLQENLPQEALQQISQAALQKPQAALSDSKLLLQSGLQIEGIPLKALQALIRIDRKPVAYEALHADFLQLPHNNIRLHVESLHQVLLTLNAAEQQALNAVVRKYGWPADNGDLHGLPEEQQHALVTYHKLVMESFKDERVLLTPQHLSKLSWDALQQEFDHAFNELPKTLKKPFTQAMWRKIKPKLQRAWSIGQRGGEQTLFFLPDLIRFGNSGDPIPIMTTAGMMAGDHALTRLLGRLRTSVVNNVHKNALLILKRISAVSSLPIATNLAKGLQRIPILSPIFTGLTIYSIVELSQQLSTLPPSSVERQVVASELFLQSTTLALIAGSPFLGAASGPLWFAFTALSLWVSAENLRQAAQLNVSFWKSLGFSLGFYQDEWQAIYQGRELAQITLDYAERLATALNSTIGWTAVKVPALNTGEWRNVSDSQIPSEVARAIYQQIDIHQYNAITGEYYYKVNEETKEVHGFKRIRKFEAVQPKCVVELESYGGCPPLRGNLLADYWQQRIYRATSVTTTMNFTNACGKWKHGNSFLSSFPAPWGNYTLEVTVHEDMGLSRAVSRNNLRESQMEYLNRGEFVIPINSYEPVEINRALINPPENIALYADKRTFSNPTAQRALHFFFDPREGDSRLVIGVDGLLVWDNMNQHHNPNYSPALDTQEYLITVQVGHKAYPDTILFPSQAWSQLSVADKTHRIASRYLIQSVYAVPFEVIDEAAHVEMVFLQSPTVKTTLSSLFLNPQNFQIILSAAEQTSNFTLLGDKTYLSLILTPQQTIDHLHLAAQQVEIMQAQGINNSSRLTLDCQVKSFTVTLRGDLTVESCGDTLSWQGKPADNTTNIHYTKLKLSNSTADALYQIQLPPETSAFPSLLQTLKRQLIHNATQVYTSFSTLGLSGYWLVPRNSSTFKQLSIQGQLNQQNATLILEETQSTLIRFTATRQPEFVLVEHDTVQTNITPTLRLQRAETSIEYAQYFPTNEEGTRVKQGLELLATLPPVGRGAVLILQSSQGYPEIHRFPNSSQRITLNGLHYQVGPRGKLYAVGAIDGRITAARLLRYNDTEHHPVGLSFPTALNASQLALDNGTLSVNQIQLIQLPEQTPLYFGPLDQQQEIISLLALQDTVLPPSTKPPKAIFPESSAHPHRHPHQRRHRRQIPDMPSSASRPTPWITTLWKGLLEMLPFYSTPLLDLGIREKPAAPPMTKEIFSERSEPLDLDKLNSFMMMLSFFLELRRIRKQQKPTAKSLPSEQAITHKHRIEWLKQLDKLEKNVEDLFKRVARDGKIVNKRNEWPKWWLEDLQEQYGKFTQVDQASQEEITVFEEKLQATLNELDEILRPSAVPPGWKRHAGQSFHKTDTTEPEPKSKPAEDSDDIIQDINILFSENSDIISAINKNDLTRVRSYIEENKNVNARSKGGRPLIMVAVENNCSIELVELLIDNGSDVNLAAYKGSFELIKLLISRGAKIKGNTEKNSPFSSIAESCLPQRTQDQVIKLLTECKYIDKTSNTTNLTRILVQQVPAMHSSLVDNAFTSLSTSNPDLNYADSIGDSIFSV